MHMLLNDARVARTMRLLLAAGAVFVAGFVLHTRVDFGLHTLFDTWSTDIVGAVAVAACAWRAAVDREGRTAWTAIGLGLALWAAGAAYWDHVLSDDAAPPLPSVADALFLGFYPLAYVAVILLVRRNARHFGVGLWCDGMIAAVVCTAVGAELVLEPIVNAAAGQSQIAALTNFSYPIGDIVLIALLAVPLAMLGTRVPRSLLLLAAGLTAFAVADALYLVRASEGTYALGGLLDAGWLVGILLVGCAALSRTGGPASGAARSWRHPAVPATAALLALYVIVQQLFADRNPTSLCLAALTLVLVVVRMTLSLRETSRLLDERARDAVTDSLTGLPNRRALVEDLDVIAAVATDERPMTVVIFDLDGFKAYNDTFGHPAGDALLARIGVSLRDAVDGRGTAFRMGGDEFCALVRADEGITSERLAAELAAAMGQHGEGFTVAASYGCALIPRHGRDATALLRRADDEMYARKGSRRAGAERQVQDALLAALRERDPDLESHAGGVAGLAAALGRRLRVGATEQRTLVHAAALHDIGKIAIPDGILHKPAPLDATEWGFVRSHPLIAQRIISAAPALSYAAQIVRSTQERWDGGGYPDQLRGEEIPLAARIVAVASAYQAMTSERPYQRALTSAEALAELQRCAGTQFDPQLVTALVDVVLHPERYEAREAVPFALPQTA